MAEPSVKGTIFKGAMDELIRLRDEGRVSEEDLEAHLAVEDLAFLESEISPSAWYPMESYDRLLRLLGEVEGAGKDAYFIERGRANARRLIEAGLYQQLAFLPRWQEAAGGKDWKDRDVAAAVAAYASKLKLVVSMASSIYNVGKWVVEPDPERPRRVRVVVREASAYSDRMRLCAEGFLNECARASREDLDQFYTSERLSPDLILFRVTRDVVHPAQD